MFGSSLLLFPVIDSGTGGIEVVERMANGGFLTTVAIATRASRTGMRL